MASVVQEYTGAPSTIVVQAPQLARSQTRLGPVTSSRWRRVSSRVVRGSTVVLCSWPLTLSVISTAPETTFGPASCTAAAAARPGPAGSRGGCGPAPHHYYCWDHVFASRDCPSSSIQSAKMYNLSPDR